MSRFEKLVAQLVPQDQTSCGIICATPRLATSVPAGLNIHCMTQSSILEKLQRALQQDLREECQVVYILVEIRKFIEQAGDLDNYHALDFHCSLALHTTVTRVGARRILERFNRAYPMLVKGEKLAEPRQRNQ